MLGTVRIQGADTAAVNSNTSVWQQAKQFTTAPSFLCKLVVFVPTAVTDSRVIWIYDLAAGGALSVDPVSVLVCPAGFTTTLDFGDYGKLFINGIYLAVATDEPAGPATARTAASTNQALIAVDYKVK